MSDLDKIQKADPDSPASNPGSLTPTPSLPPAIVTATPPEIPSSLTQIPSQPPAATKPAAVPKKYVPPSNDPITRFRNKNVVEEEGRMGFIDHLMELRKRMWIAIIACVICVFLALIFYGRIYAFLKGPIDRINIIYSGPTGDPFRKPGLDGTPAPLKPGELAIVMTSTSPLSTMVLVIWLGFWGGIVLSSPIMLYQIWAFIAPGLKVKEKSAIKPVLYGGLLFFLTGVFICYYLMIPPTLNFFVWLDLDLKNRVMWTSETTIDLILWMMILSGLLCEIPLIVAALAKMDVLRGSTLVKHWRGMTFGSIVIGSIVAPGNDLASLGVFSGLMLGIYLVSILMAYIFQQKKPRKT